MRATPGTSSRKSPSRFGSIRLDRSVTPVTLPPGRLKLATKPWLTGSPPIPKTIGIVAVARLAASERGVAANRCEHVHPATHQIGGERRQFAVFAARPAVLDRDVLALAKAALLETLPKRSKPVPDPPATGCS